MRRSQPTARRRWIERGSLVEAERVATMLVKTVQCCADETADWSEFASTVAIKSCGRTSGPVDLAFAVDSLDEPIFIGALDGSSGGCLRTRRDIRLSVESDISALMPRPHELPPRRQAQCVAACGSML